MRISVAFPPIPQTPAHIELAEQLGYQTAWVYDTPALQLDVWMILAFAAERTDRIQTRSRGLNSRPSDIPW